ncbi:unnamed protein product [Onchocerca ochengi]|uniref:Cadherin domain-containing protein n=1 Tax=Onchocerca ochengi TaxID=42157 RepID=A0A182EBV8_ONCOC|nr:unnamed protein product [Onchocerca ochengi]
MPEKITLPASDGSLMIAGEKTIEEIAEEFRKDETQNTASIKINQMNDSNLQVSASEMSAFLHSVTDRDAVEKLVRDSNLIPAKEHSNLSEPPIENMLDFITFDTPVSNLKTVTVTNHTTLNDLDYPVEKVPDSFIIWSDPQIFIEPIHIAKFNFGQEILSVKAHDTFNSSIEFICMLPEFVFCVTDLLSNESYQLRMFYTGTSKIKNFSLPLAIRTRNREGNSYASFNASIHFVSDDSNMNDEIRSEISSMTTQQTVQYQVEATIENDFHVQPNFIALEDQSVSTWNGSTIQPEEATRKPETPVFIFMPHFEQNNYEIYVPEGKNKNSIIVAIIYFLTYPSDAEAKFSIQSEPLQWFYLGEIEAEMNANRLIVAIKLMLHDGADVDFKKTNNGHYKFQIKANQGSFETSTNINVEVLTFATKETFYSSDMITISSANLTSLREKFTTPRVLADSEHHTAVHFTDISDNESRIITATVSNMEQIDINTATASGSSDIKITQTELAKDTLETTEESPVRKNFAETFQSTEAITKIAKSAKEKGSERFSILTVNEIARYPSESTMKANKFEPLQEPEITPVTLPEIFENDDSSHSEIDNLDTVHNTSVSSERRTSTISETHDNALAMEISQSSKRIEFNENMDNFSSYNQEELVAKKSTTIVVSSIRNGSNLFPNVPVGDGKSLHDEFGASLMSMTTISAPVNDGDIDNMQWSNSQDNKQYDENFQKSTENLKTNTNIKQDYITTTETTNLMIHELNKNAETDAHFVDDDTSYAENDIYTGVENDYHTSTYINVTWKNRTDNISTITNNADTTVPSSEMTETVSIDRSTNAAILQQTSISLTDNIHMNSNNEMNRSWNQSGDENFGINKSQRIHLAWQQTSSDKTTTATVLHSETSRIETEAKSEWPEEDESLENGFGINKIEPQETMINDPNDVIMVSVNSSALEVIPRRMQPGKTVFLVVRDAEKLDRDLLDGSIVIKVTASQRKHPSVTSSKVISIMRNENLSNEAPAFLSPEYDFHVNEGSITGQKVGQMEAEFMDHREHGIITYQLIGSGSELFAINGGTISVSCPSVLPCLDREQTITYHLLAIATNRNGLNSVPAIVRIHIVDRNDNGPILETLQNEITVFNGRLTKPFVVKVKDNDVTPHDINEISIDGTASAFISLEKVRDDIYYGRLWSLPAVGIYELNITARDPDGNNPEQKITVIAQVLNAVTRAHFERAKYERTINTEKLFKGNLILQPKLENAPLDALRFVLLRNDPGWLSMDEYSGNVIIGDVPQTDIVNGKYSTSIAAVNRTDGRLVTESVLVLTVISDNHVKEVFTKKLIVKTLRKDTTINRQTIEVLPEQNKASITIVRDSINAFDEQLHYVNIDENAISIDHGMIIIDMKRLQQIRMLQFNLFSKEDTNDSAKVMLFLSSEPIEMEHERKRQAQPRFSHPWRSDMNIIPIKLAENSSEGYTIISLPAYNPMDGTKIIDLRLSGEMAQHFTVDGRSGDVQVVIPFDFEAMEPESHIFDLQLIAGEEPYDTVAVLRVEIIDIDDNPPKIAKIGDYNFENLTIAENSRPGTVLFEVQISDPDYLYGKIGVFSYALSGNGAANFQVKKINDTVAVIVSPAADLDREKIEEMIVLLKVTDSGGNSDSVAAMITIIDVNDNVPVFIHSEYKIEAVENWPEAMILTYVHAEDNDNGLNADIRYSLSPKNNEYFEIDPIRGLIHTKKALIGLARAHPYDFSVVASDQGSPSLSASTAVSIHVLESTSLSRVGDDKGIHIVSPSVHFTLLLDENTPANDRVYSVQAKIGGFNEQFGREIKYSITPVDNAMDGGWFTIDTNSGDLFTLQELDHELQSAITVSLFLFGQIPMHKIH